ncbi:Uncharacterised protein [Mycobacteroides abscessus subsp. abscessus]|nr:Uncharacterised protein [Mycobacteroides abscessus subsp. abscessus]
MVQSSAGSGCPFMGCGAMVSQVGSPAKRAAFWSGGGGACLALVMVMANSWSNKPPSTWSVPATSNTSERTRASTMRCPRTPDGCLSADVSSRSVLAVV